MAKLTIYYENSSLTFEGEEAREIRKVMSDVIKLRMRLAIFSASGMDYVLNTDRMLYYVYNKRSLELSPRKRNRK
jgi:hypothetical protein